jgi:hypothetical protein
MKAHGFSSQWMEWSDPSTLAFFLLMCSSFSFFSSSFSLHVHGSRNLGYGYAHSAPFPVSPSISSICILKWIFSMSELGSVIQMFLLVLPSDDRKVVTKG